MLLLRVAIFTVLIGLMPIIMRANIAYFDFQKYFLFVFQEADLFMLSASLSALNIEKIIGYSTNNMNFKYKYGSISVGLLVLCIPFLHGSYARDFQQEGDKTILLVLSGIFITLSILTSIVVLLKIKE